MDFMFHPTSFMEQKAKDSYVHLMPRFKIAQNVINNIKMLESSGRTQIQFFPLTNLQDRIVQSTGANSKDFRELLKQLVLDQYNKFGYQHIQEFVQKVDIKFLEQVSDPSKTPEIHTYLQQVGEVN
mmetsp:Transcript_10545/g.9304  ORF Transcript_10545/g.9304 Transcript_10545/m.9304 type:complete len:126 (+) Transcript_10545:79-456(+)